MMAGAILPDRTLAQINDANFMALKTAKGQLKEAQALNADLRAGVSALTKENGDLARALVAEQTRTQTLIGELMDKDREIADLCGKLLAARAAVGFLQPEAKP